MFVCSNCECEKPESHYTKEMIDGKADLVCNNCRRRYFTFLVCTVCHSKKKGLHFTSLMLNGNETPTCHGCKASGVAIVNHSKKQRDHSVVQRNCLRCDKEFMARNKFMRICRSCKSSTDIEQDWFRNE